MRHDRGRHVVVIAALLSAAACAGQDATSLPTATDARPTTDATTTTAAPATTTTAAPATTSATTTTTSTPAAVTTLPEPTVIDLRDIAGPVREPTTVRAEFGIGDGPSELGVEVANESAGRGPSNPTLLSDGTVAIVDQVNERFVVVPPDGQPSTSTPDGTVWADCIRVGPRDVVYSAGAGSPGGGISAFIIDRAGVTRVAGPSGLGLATSPTLGRPAEVPAFTSTEAWAWGTQPLALVDRDGTLLVGAEDELPDSVVGGSTVHHPPGSVVGGSTVDELATFARVDIGGDLVGQWTVLSPKATDPDSDFPPGVVWMAPIGEDGIVVGWEVPIDGGTVLAIARLGPAGLVDAFTIPATWQLDGTSCTNPVADEDHLVALVPKRSSGVTPRTESFELMEWDWS
jgi:hypothetical protein